MIAVPANLNAIEVRMIQTGCLKSEFDSTYPIHLNGIIGQDEFQQSIENINQAISSRKSLIICGLIVIICIVGGMILFIAGGLLTVNSTTHGFSVLVSNGIGVFFLGMIVLSFGCCFIRLRRANRMRKAVANESMKYLRRSPTPCSWRLLASRSWTGGYRRRRALIIYRLVIEIGHSVAPGNGNVPYQFNQVATQPISFFPQQNDMSAPPPYYSLSTAGFCPHCGVARQNPTAKFCSSCGQPLYM